MDPWVYVVIAVLLIAALGLAFAGDQEQDMVDRSPKPADDDDGQRLNTRSRDP